MRMNEYGEYCEDNKDIHFLFETKTWNGKSISDMSSSHIINSALMLLRKSTTFKLNYELFVIDHSNDNLLRPVDSIEELATMDARTWIKTTPIFIAFLKELGTRKLLSYFEIVLDRTEKEMNEEKGE